MAQRKWVATISIDMTVEDGHESNAIEELATTLNEVRGMFDVELISVTENGTIARLDITVKSDVEAHLDEIY